tara:strand:+ start:1338 stop:2009 length:672 start_codon:yes stop_codon:yes gene_type:complete
MKNVSLYTKVSSRLKNGRHYRDFNQEKEGLQLQAFTAEKPALEESLANKEEILSRAAELAIPTVIISSNCLQFLGNNDVKADEILTEEQIKAIDTSENHWGRSTFRSEVSCEGVETLEFNLNYDNYVVLSKEQGFYEYDGDKFVRIKNRYDQITKLWNYGFASKRGRPIKVGRNTHSGTKVEIIYLVDWLTKLRQMNSGSEIQFKTQQIYNTLNRHYAWPEHW